MHGFMNVIWVNISVPLVNLYYTCNFCFSLTKNTVHLYLRQKPVDILYGNISDLINRTKSTDTLCGKRRNLILQQVEYSEQWALKLWVLKRPFSFLLLPTAYRWSQRKIKLGILNILGSQRAYLPTERISVSTRLYRRAHRLRQRFSLFSLPRHAWACRPHTRHTSMWIPKFYLLTTDTKTTLEAIILKLSYIYISLLRELCGASSAHETQVYEPKASTCPSTRGSDVASFSDQTRPKSRST
jgi:hypothetical protein